MLVRNTMDYLVEAKLTWASDCLDSTVPQPAEDHERFDRDHPWSDFVDNRVLRTDPQNLFRRLQEYRSNSSTRPSPVRSSIPACTAISAAAR